MAATSCNSCTVPDGHSIRTVATFVASPRPKCANKPLWFLAPPEIRRNCRMELPPIRVVTRTFAPIPERLDSGMRGV